MKKTLLFGVGLALAGFLTTAANASPVIYHWVSAPGQPAAQGTLTFDPALSGIGAEPTSYSFTVEGTGGFTDDELTLPSPVQGTEETLILPDGDLVMSTNISSPSGEDWLNQAYYGYFGSSPLEESVFHPTYGVSVVVQGDWVPASVPEPATMIVEAMVLLPFAAGRLRMLRKRHSASAAALLRPFAPSEVWRGCNAGWRGAPREWDA